MTAVDSFFPQDASGPLKTAWQVKVLCLLSTDLHDGLKTSTTVNPILYLPGGNFQWIHSECKITLFNFIARYMHMSEANIIYISKHTIH